MKLGVRGTDKIRRVVFCDGVKERRLGTLVQDLAVVVLLMLIPLLAPSESGAPAGLKTIAKALGIAAVKVGLLATTRLPIASISAAGICHMLYILSA